MINLVKTMLIHASGRLTDRFEPFEELTRKLPMKGTGLTYAQRAELFESDFVNGFRLPNGVYAYRIHDAQLVIGDQALWHGIATAMWAFKYSVTQSPADALLLLDAVKAMEVHFPPPRHWLIRGVDPEGADNPATLRYADDASNDTATGPLAGAYFAWLYGDPNSIAAARRIMRYLAQELLENHYCLMKRDCTPTTYGRLVDGWKTDPLRVSLAMAIFMAAYDMTLESQYMNAFDELASKYRELLRKPLLKFLWLTHTYEAHRAAIHLTILADRADEKTKSCALDGLDYIRWAERKAGNSWILALLSRHLALTLEERDIYRGRQLEYEPSQRGPAVERTNSDRASWWGEFGVRFIKWGGETRATQALPYWMLASQDFFPQRHPFQADGWIGDKTPTGYHSGLDFLVSHWLGVKQGLVGRDE